MKSGTPLFRFPFVSRKKYLELSEKLFELQTEKRRYEKLSSVFRQSYFDVLKDVERLSAEIKYINLKRNAKGQWERRAK